MIRIKPLNPDYRMLASKFLSPIGYQGNNLLCSDWDAEHMEKLDYNGLYEYLYALKNGEKFDGSKFSDGIPSADFEAVMMEYLPVTVEQLRQYAAFNSDHQTYKWQPLGCQNMVFYLVSLIDDKVISFDDLEGFSNDVQEAVRYLHR